MLNYQRVVFPKIYTHVIPIPIMLGFSGALLITPLQSGAPVYNS
jgi:hypothetical protein